MRVESVPIDNIDIPPRLRGVDAGKVRTLADSMDAIGLRQPITIWAKPESPFQLVAGAHRLEAAQFLGWEWIDAVFIDADDIDRQLWEIDENLMRSELTPTQEAEHLAKRKELWEAREIQVAQLAPPEIGYGRPPQQSKGFAAETADKTGISKATVNRAISRARDIAPEVLEEVRGTDMDKGTILDQLRKVPLSEQAAKLHSLRDAREYEDPDEKQFAAIKSAYLRASMEARQRFDDWYTGQ